MISARPALRNLALSPAELALSVMPCERQLVLIVIEKAESPAFFNKPPQVRRAQPVGLGFGDGPQIQS